MLKIIAFSVCFYSRMPKINLPRNKIRLFGRIKYFFKSKNYIFHLGVFKINVDASFPELYIPLLQVGA
ncbi:hypothetical protein EEE70_05135 [Neisseria gonorrhoeae]|nr:hypothetical protein A6J44_02120 [Neisseria gonorrhoeae]OIA77181.1 hypothetical protein BB035_00485 [Neisseria gonorrhoeae]ROU34706.1 hypothetical protein EGP27_04495 [Neisseria gonorrhoeae]ROU46232.1 hypothetical protein EGO70_02565 [Neisseria gonorrhoeae]TJW29791.1 hypothetical protein E8M74_04020 [Neisseria gonorrhoeae]